VTNREKIIVAMAGAAILYGLFSTFSEPDRNDVPVGSSTSAAVVLGQEVLQDAPADAAAARQVLANAQRPWQNEAFLVAGLDQESDSGLKGAMDVPPDVEGIVYSGYMEMAGEQIAIINNSEYRAGDQVEIFTIKEITPSSIRLSWEGREFGIAFQEVK